MVQDSVGIVEPLEVHMHGLHMSHGVADIARLSPTH